MRASPSGLGWSPSSASPTHRKGAFSIPIAARASTTPSSTRISFFDPRIGRKREFHSLPKVSRFPPLTRTEGLETGPGWGALASQPSNGGLGRKTFADVVRATGLDRSAHSVDRRPQRTRLHPLRNISADGSSLGFSEEDLIGAPQVRHLTSHIHHIWDLPTHERIEFGGGWREIPLRPPASYKVDWPRVGIGNVEMADSRHGGRIEGNQWAARRDRRDDRGQVSRSGGQHQGQVDSRGGSFQQGYVDRGRVNWRPKQSSTREQSKPATAASSQGMATAGSSSISKSANETVKIVPCSKCGKEGHQPKDCNTPMKCIVCLKETHVTEMCVWPRQPKPVMPLVGLAVEGLAFFSAQHGKMATKRVKKHAMGLVKVIEGALTEDLLVKDLAYHFQWGCEWKVSSCGAGFLVQFPSKERLDELVHFPEFKLRSGARVVLSHWNAQAVAKARLHSVWLVAENVPEELLNYHGICEIGSQIGAVEDVDMLALEEKDTVRFLVDVKSIAKIPPVIEVAVKPFLYDVYIKLEKVVEKGWNRDLQGTLGKRASVELDHELTRRDKDSNQGKKLKDLVGNDTPSGSKMTKQTAVPDNKSQPKNQKQLEVPAKEMATEKTVIPSEEKDSESNKNDPLNLNGESQDSGEKLQLDDSQIDLDESSVGDFAAAVGAILSQESVQKEDLIHDKDDGFQQVKKKKTAKSNVTNEPTRRSERLGGNDEKVADKAVERAEAKDAFLNKDREVAKTGGTRKPSNSKGGK